MYKRQELTPSFISVTYGAGGGTSKNTVKIASHIKNDLKIPALAHLTCVSSTKEEVHKVIGQLQKEGIENILALRGDIPQDGQLSLIHISWKERYVPMWDLRQEDLQTACCKMEQSRCLPSMWDMVSWTGNYVRMKEWSADVYKRQEEINMDKLVGTSDMKKIKDLKDRPLLLFVNSWSIRMVLERNEGLKLSEFGRS